MASLLYRLGTFVTSHRRRIQALWLIALLAVGAVAGGFAKGTTDEFRFEVADGGVQLGEAESHEGGDRTGFAEADNSQPRACAAAPRRGQTKRASPAAGPFRCRSPCPGFSRPRRAIA